MTSVGADGVAYDGGCCCCCCGGGESDKEPPSKLAKKIPSCCVVARAYQMEAKVVIVVVAVDEDLMFWIYVDPEVFVERKESFSGCCGFESPSRNHALVQESGVRDDDDDQQSEEESSKGSLKPVEDQEAIEVQQEKHNSVETVAENESSSSAPSLE